MKFCQYCGNELMYESVICTKCGCSTGKDHVEDRAGCALPFLSFLVPLIGLVLWAVWHRDYPRKASACGKAALFSWTLSVIIGCLVGVFYAQLLYSFF